MNKTRIVLLASALALMTGIAYHAGKRSALSRARKVRDYYDDEDCFDDCLEYEDVDED